MWRQGSLAVAIIAMSIVMFVPLPLWVAVTLMSVALLIAVVITVQLFR